MSRLVVVFNWVVVLGENCVGGLVVGLLVVFKECGGVWFGWSGKVVCDFSGVLYEQVDGDICYVMMDFNKCDVDGYYNGFVNCMLWLLLYFCLDLVDYDCVICEMYCWVNVLFVEKFVLLLCDDDIVWIYDYYLILLVLLLCECGIGCCIGFFLYVLMFLADLLQVMLDYLCLFFSLYVYDLVGFQIQCDVDCFQLYVCLFGGGCVVGDGELEVLGGWCFCVVVFLIGIDIGYIVCQVGVGVSKLVVCVLCNSLGDCQLVIGVDCLDYFKGLFECFFGFECYFECYFDQCGSLIYLQIVLVLCGDVNEYCQLCGQLEQIVGYINGGYVVLDWMLLCYVNQNFIYVILIGFYWVVVVGLVILLCDGMNLVVKEYVVLQDLENFGVLVLLLLVGVVDELKYVLLVNLYDLDGVVDVIVMVVIMLLCKCVEWWQVMMDYLCIYDINYWWQIYLEVLESV